MNKKKILKKRDFSLEDIQPIKLHSLNKFTEHKPSDFFKNEEKVGAALLQSLIDNDSEAFMEILDSYLRVNRSQIAKKSNLTRVTISRSFNKDANPTIKTIAKIVHYSATQETKK